MFRKLFRAFLGLVGDDRALARSISRAERGRCLMGNTRISSTFLKLVSRSARLPTRGCRSLLPQEPSGNPNPTSSRVVSAAPTAAGRREGTHRNLGGSRPNLAPQTRAGDLPKGRNHRGTTSWLARNPRRPCTLGSGNAAFGEQGTRARIINHHVSTLRRRRNHPEART
jgi:hypothetical protein